VLTEVFFTVIVYAAVPVGDSAPLWELIPTEPLKELDFRTVSVCAPELRPFAVVVTDIAAPFMVVSVM
jgi:hypothetical protein